MTKIVKEFEFPLKKTTKENHGENSIGIWFPLNKNYQENHAENSKGIWVTVEQKVPRKIMPKMVKEFKFPKLQKNSENS